MSSLVIVESASKCKTIKRYLGEGYYVTFSAGHICDLPKDSLGINTEMWTALYQPTNKKIIENIRGLARKCERIYIASDPDIEGEAIAFHIKNSIKDLIKNKSCYRIKFNEITKNIILNAIENPVDIDMHIVEAQETRRMADRLIGYKISPLLWKVFGNNFLSAGRVQIASLIICINQRNKILKKEIVPIWTIQGKFKIGKENLSADLMQIDTNAIWKTNNNSDTLQYLQALHIDAEYRLKYDREDKQTSPFPPYTTTSLQQDAYNKLRMSSKTTMKLAQDLYEHGHITYMRTDSVAISEEAKFKIIDFVKKTYGTDKSKYRTYKTKVVNAQEAHEAIRITKPDVLTIDKSFEGCSTGHCKLYEMIWRRSIACMMTDAVFTNTKISIYDKVNVFQCSKNFLIDEGFYLAYEPKRVKEDSELQAFVELLKCNACKSKEFISKGEVSDIPSMYNEVQLIKELEKEGIGRPSTYATTIDKLIGKKYVEHGMNPQQCIEVDCYKKTKSGIITSKNTIKLGGSHKDLLIPTDLGISIIEYIYSVADYLCDLKFTAKMETDMDEIMHERASKREILDALHSKILETVSQCPNTPKNQIKQERTYKEMIQTRYGLCYYDADTKKYTNIEPYLKWRKKTVETIDQKDMAFIKSLPKRIEKDGQIFYLHLGKFGLYLKDTHGNNLKLDRALWDNYA